MKKKLVESTLGIKTTEKLARKLDEVLKGLPPDQRGVRRKSDTRVTEINAGERSEVSVITTSGMDRECEIVLPEGIEYDDFARYGTVLFGHSQQQPCGKSVWIKTRPDALLAKTSYPRRPGDLGGEWLPDFVWSMIAADVLKGKSIGFIPTEVRDPTEEELARHPDCQRVITRSWLIEYSVVSTPCNPQALVESIGKGIGLAHWGWKVVGRIRPKAPTKTDKMASVRNGIGAVRIDYEKIVEDAVKKIRDRWEV